MTLTSPICESAEGGSGAVTHHGASCRPQYWLVNPDTELDRFCAHLGTRSRRTRVAEVTYDGASRVYAGTPPVRAVDTLDLEVADGEFLVLVGPSGSGKSTALRMLAGLEDVDEGAIRIGGRDVTNVPPKDRDIAMVFQSYALYPHMTVAREHGLRAQAPGRQQDRDRRQGQRGSRDAGPREVPGPQAQGALRWSAPARRDGPRDRARARGVPDGRAAVQPGREAAGGDPRQHRRPAAPARHHHGLRHPRPGRGHDHGPPGRRAQGRPAAAVRHAARPLRPARPTCSSPASSARRR